MSSYVSGPPGSAYTAPVPGVSQAGGVGLAAKTAYQKALTNINMQRSGLLRQYGYTGQVDPQTGLVTNMRVDPYNQYGGLQMMLRNQAQQDQGAQDANMARGLVGGLANQAETDLRFQHGDQSAKFGQALVGDMGGLDQQQGSAYNQYANTLWQQQQLDTQNNIASQNFNPADFSGLNYPGYGSDANNYPKNPQPTDTTTTPPNLQTTGTARRIGLVSRMTAPKSAPAKQASAALAARSQALNKKYGLGKGGRK